MTAPPPLRTARLTLRTLQAGDRPALTALFASPAVRRHLDVEVETFEEARSFADEFVRRALAEAGGVTTGALAIVPHGTGRLVGYCGLRPLPDRLDAAELTYALVPQAWGTGYATEAGRAVLDHGFERPGLAETLAMARPANRASCRVLERLGFRHDGLSERYYVPATELYRLDRAGWVAARAAVAAGLAPLLPTL